MAKLKPMDHGPQCRCSDPIANSEELRKHQQTFYKYLSLIHI